MSSIERDLITSPVYGEVSPRLATNVFADQELKAGLRKAYNVMISRNGEVVSRPPTHDVCDIGVEAGITARSFQFRLPSGEFLLLTFTYQLCTIRSSSTGTTLLTFTTDWDATDIEPMDGCNYENDMIFVTPAKEPMLLQYDPDAQTFDWATLASKKAGTDDPPWHATQEWPISVSFMIGRFVLVSKRHYYGSKAGDVLNWDIKVTTAAGDDVVTPSSAFSFNIADDLDSGFEWVRGGQMVFGGSPAGVWMMSNLSTPVNTQNPEIKNYSSIGCYGVPAVSITGGELYFCNDGITVKLFAVGPQGYTNQIMNPYSKHFFEEAPPKRMVFQRTPDTIVWILRTDGVLITFTLDEKRRAWTKLELDGEVKDIWLGKSNTREFLYIDIERPNGRRIERFENVDPFYEQIIADQMVYTKVGDAKPIEMTSPGLLGDSGPAIFKVTAHGYENGDIVRTVGIEPTYAYITDKTDDSFQLQLENQQWLTIEVGSDFSVQAASFEFTFPQYKNLEIDVYADGYFYSVEVADDGLVKLPVPGSEIYMGIPYKCYIQPRSFIDIHGNFPATINKIHPRVYKTCALLYGRTEEELSSKNLTSEGEESLLLAGGINYNRCYTGTVRDLAIVGGMDYECSFTLGSTRTPFVMSSCVVEIEVGGS